jgi:aminoglycoside phosphotransferase (APT) family kinase protein
LEEERPTPQLADVEATRKKLQAWLAEQRGQTTLRIPRINIPESTGMSNVTLLFDVEWQENGDTHREPCVGRLQPEVARPVFPAYDLGLQYEVMDSLARHSDIPVPPLRGLELDQSVLGVQFYLMRHVPGRIPTDMPPYNLDGWMMHETDESQRAAMWRAAVETLGRFHRLDYRQLGFGRLEVAGQSPLQVQLGYWRDYMAWALEGRDHPVCRAALDWLQANQPADEPTVLCWGDARIANMIFTESLDGVAAVLDWEMATLGNPVQDLAWFNHLDATFAEGLGLPRLPGLPGYGETVEQWQSVSGFDARDYDYYRVFAGLRFGLILSRIMLTAGQEAEIEGNFACQVLQRQLEELG